MAAGSNLARIKNKEVQTNNTSGCTGVSFHKVKGQWYARISFKGKSHSLGYFDKMEDAIRARKKAEKMTFDEFIESMSRKKIIEI